MAATASGNPWYGTSRARLLEGLTPEQAAASPFPGGHSIWQLVLHMTSWTLEVTRRLGGAMPRAPREGNWPRMGRLSSRGWETARRRLDAAHAKLLAALEKMPASRWSDRVPGSGVDVTGMLIGLAQHDAYHIGQVAMAKRAILTAR